MLKILHLLSNWKWTERAEPAADLVLGQIRLGANATFLCGRCPFDANDAVEHRARAKGLQPVVMDLDKHFNPLTAFVALGQMRRFFRENRYEVVHAHMTNAQFLGGLATRRALPSARFICTFYEPAGPPHGFRQNYVLKRCMDGAIVMTARAREHLAGAHGFPESRIAVIEPGLDLERFQAPVSREEARASFGLKPGDRVVGMVTRIREARRLDLVLEAVARLAPRHPDLKLMVVGRGGEGAVESILEEPALALGIRDRLLLPGYCRDRRLVEAYKAMDVLAYPVPGTDPSCRTIREAMAAGLPVVAGRVGYAPDLVTDGDWGYTAPLEVEAMAAALEKVLTEPGRCAEMGRRAAAAASARFSSNTQAQRCLAFYETVEPKR